MLNQETSKFLYPFILDMKRKGVTTLYQSNSKDEEIRLRFMSETTLGIKFALEIDKLFSLTMICQDGNIIVYRCEDAEHYPNRYLYSIDEINLIKELKPNYKFHFLFQLFAEAVLNVIRTRTSNKSYHQTTLSYDSFKTIRFILFVLIAECPHVEAWGTKRLSLTPEAVHIHFQAFKMKLCYNAGIQAFDISFYKESQPIFQRSGIHLKETINYIDNKIACIPNN